MEAMTGVIDADLSGVIASAAAGDDLAFARIVGAYHAEMTRICVVVARDATLAEEAVQAAWSIAWRKLGSVRDPARLRPWLVSVAVNEARQLLRGRRRRVLLEITGDATEPSGGIDPSTGVGTLDLRGAVERLDPDDRALLALRYLAGFDATELSKTLGISPAAVRQRLKRLLDRLREDLDHG